MKVRLTIAVRWIYNPQLLAFFYPQHSKEMFLRDSSFHHRGSKDPQGISQGWLQQGFSQVKQPMVLAKQVGNCVGILVCSNFCSDFLSSFSVLRSWKSKVTHHCRVHRGLEAQRGFLFCSVEIPKLVIFESEQSGKGILYKMGNKSCRLFFALHWTWG